LKKVDFLIVGQGIAGSLLAHFLLENDKTVAIVDNQHAFSSSVAAAGIINPITGRNFVKTWLADETINQSIQFYQQLETQFNSQFYNPLPLVWLLENIKQCNDWQILSANEHISYFIDKNNNLDNHILSKHFNYVVDNVILAKSGKINLVNILDCFKKLLLQHTYLSEKFNFTELIIKDKIYYKNIIAEKIIFCEGYQAAENPFFNDLHYKFAKGEILIAKIPNYEFPNHIIKHKGLLIAPQGEDLYWVGSSYDRDFSHILPTETAYRQLINDFNEIYIGKYDIFSYLAAVRPTVRDRKPYLGQHKTEKKVYIFNGLGAKGSYLAPYFAKMMSDFLLEKQLLHKEVDIQRIYKKQK
jgi:glycine oxidase